MTFPTRGEEDLYGLQGFGLQVAEVQLADGPKRYIVTSLHVTPIADSAGALRALPAVCLDIAKADELATALAKAVKKARRG